MIKSTVVWVGFTGGRSTEDTEAAINNALEKIQLKEGVITLLKTRELRNEMLVIFYDDGVPPAKV